MVGECLQMLSGELVVSCDRLCQQGTGLFGSSTRLQKPCKLRREFWVIGNIHHSAQSGDCGFYVAQGSVHLGEVTLRRRELRHPFYRIKIPGSGAWKLVLRVPKMTALKIEHRERKWRDAAVPGFAFLEESVRKI
jgi:hypothetical protein